jgi:hypothetical protein
MGACGPILSCHTLNVVASRGPDTGSAYPVLKALGRSDLMPGLIPGRGGRRSGLTSSEILPAHD